MRVYDRSATKPGNGILKKHRPEGSVPAFRAIHFDSLQRLFSMVEFRFQVSNEPARAVGADTLLHLSEMG